MAQPLVLAIEPDLRQAAIVKRIVKEKALADVAVVDSRDAAIEAIKTTMPDVLLLSALLSPRDEDELMAHLRTLDNAGHLQTHTIPQLASALGPGEGRASRGLLSAFRRKKEPEPLASGCDPELFAEEIRVFIQRAADKRRELLDTPSRHDAAPGPAASPRVVAADSEPDGAAPDSSWSSPFEWKPTRSMVPESAGHGSPVKESPAIEPPVAAPVLEEPALAAAANADLSIAENPPAESPVAQAVVTETESVVAAAPATESLSVTPVVVEQAAELLESNETGGALDAEAAIAALGAGPAPVADVPKFELAMHAVPLDDLELPAIEIVTASTDEEVTLEPVQDDGVTVDLFAAPELTVADRPAARTTQPATHAPVQERAEKIAARVQEAMTSATEASEAPAHSQWTQGAEAANARRSERLGALARWARKEAGRQQKTEQVTADDVRALMSSLSVPIAVAWISYPRGCRIRRVRVPPATERESGEAVGAVILSRRALAEQREKRPSA